MNLDGVIFHWGSAYRIDQDGDGFTAIRRDTGAMLRAESPERLDELIRQDYIADPVPR